MKISKSLSILLLVLMLMLSACGVLREPEAPSAPIESVPLEVEEETAAEPAETTEEAVEEPAAAESDTAIAEPAASTESNVTIFEINQDSSHVRFELDEDLRGNRITVVGQTNQVAGQIAADYADLSTLQVGVIQINARALETDNNFRNRAIQNEILVTGLYEFITFTPTAVNGLPASVAIGDSVQFTIVGDLSILDQTHEVTFDVEATAVSETEFAGTATAVINRADFNLLIPSVPNVANVEEEVELYIDFTANAS